MRPPLPRRIVHAGLPTVVLAGALVAVPLTATSAHATGNSSRASSPSTRAPSSPASSTHSLLGKHRQGQAGAQKKHWWSRKPHQADPEALGDRTTAVGLLDEVKDGTPLAVMSATKRWDDQSYFMSRTSGRIKLLGADGTGTELAEDADDNAWNEAASKIRGLGGHGRLVTANQQTVLQSFREVQEISVAVLKQLFRHYVPDYGRSKINNEAEGVDPTVINPNTAAPRKHTFFKYWNGFRPQYLFTLRRMGESIRVQQGRKVIAVIEDRFDDRQWDEAMGKVILETRGQAAYHKYKGNTLGSREKIRVGAFALWSGPVGVGGLAAMYGITYGIAALVAL